MQFGSTEMPSVLKACVVMCLVASNMNAQEQFTFKNEVPNEAGWHDAKWGMSVQEVAKAIGKDFKEEKRDAKAKNAAYALRGKLISKLSVDGMECQVSFGFSAEDKLNIVWVSCDKVKAEVGKAVAEHFTTSFGELWSYQRYLMPTYFPGEVQGVDRNFSYRKDNRLVTFWTYDKGVGEGGIFDVLRQAMTRSHRLGFTVSVRNSEDAFGQKGEYYFAGDVMEKPGKPMSCSMEIVPAATNLKIHCKKKGVILETKMAGDYRIKVGKGFDAGGGSIYHKLEFPTLVAKKKPVKVLAASDLVESLRKWFPNNTE